MDFLRAQSFAERTVGARLAEMRHFLSFLAGRGVTEAHQITRLEVEAYQLSLLHQRKTDGAPLAIRTRHTKMSAVLGFLRFLHHSKVILLNPGRHIVQPRLPGRLLPELPTEEQVVKLLEAPDVSCPLGLRDRAVLEVLYSSALRNKELRDLKLEDLDLGRLQLRVQNGKGRKSRVVPLGEPAAAWLEEYLSQGRAYFLRRQENGFVFLTIRGNRMPNGALCLLVKKYNKLSKIGCKVTPHILRHCCSTHMLARGAEIRHLQELLGHASPATTQVYTQVDLSQLRAVHQRCHPRESF